MYDYTLHRERKHFCGYCLLALKTADVLKCYIEDCFKTNGKQLTKMTAKGEYVNFKNHGQKIQSPFMTYANFESILMPENNEKQYPNNSYTKNIKNMLLAVMAINYYVSMISFNSYLGEDAVYKFVNSIVEGSKYCEDLMKQYFNKELAINKKDNKDFKNSTKCWICDNDYVDCDVKVRDHYHFNVKYKDPSHRDCIIKVKLNHKVLVVFYNLKNYDSHLAMGKLNLKIQS